MTWPPAIVRVRMARGGRGLRLCVPLFLLWPLILVLAALLVPLIVLVGVCCGRRGRWVVAVVPLACVALWSLTGLQVRLRAGERDCLDVEFR